MEFIAEYPVEKNGINYIIKKFAVKDGYLYQPFNVNGELLNMRRIRITSENASDMFFDPKFDYFIDALRDFFVDKKNS